MDRKGFLAHLLTALVTLLIILGCVFGYGKNIYKAVKLDWEPNWKAEAFRVAGIFIPPVGVIMGYVEFDEEEKEVENATKKLRCPKSSPN